MMTCYIHEVKGQLHWGVRIFCKRCSVHYSTSRGGKQLARAVILDLLLFFCLFELLKESEGE